jgi:hypothetical protein
VQSPPILVTDQACQRAFSVQVKTNSGAANFWLVGKHTAVSPTHVYVLVDLNSQKKEDAKPEFFIVPSSVLKKRTLHEKHAKSEWWSVCRNDYPGKGIKGVLVYKDKWDVFGDPHAEVRKELVQ